MNRSTCRARAGRADAKRARRCGPSLRTDRLGRRLGLDELARLVDDDVAARELGRVRKRLLELLLAQPAGGDAGRLVGLRRGVEEADGRHDAVAGVDEGVAIEARELAQHRQEALVDLLDELALTALIDRLVAANGAVH